MSTSAYSSSSSESAGPSKAAGTPMKPKREGSKKKGKKPAASPPTYEVTEQERAEAAEIDALTGGCSVLSTAMCIACFPFAIPMSFLTVDQNSEVVVSHWGAYTETLTDPGCNWSNICGRDVVVVSTKSTAIDLPNQKMIDATGSPLIVSGIVTYRFVHTKRTALLVSNAHGYISTQATASLKRVVSRYPYESDDGGECLKDEAAEIAAVLVDELQRKVAKTGAVINSFQFNEISYAPEIAAGMLKRQQATALLQARKIIVNGAVEIASEAVNELEQRGIDINDDQKAKLVSNLLVVLCSESSAQPTVPLD